MEIVYSGYIWIQYIQIVNMFHLEYICMPSSLILLSTCGQERSIQRLSLKFW